MDLNCYEGMLKWQILIVILLGYVLQEYVKNGIKWYQPTYTSVYNLSINQETHNHHYLIRSNVVVETVPRPVQISELLENGLFYTNTGEKAVPAQVMCIPLTIFLSICNLSNIHLDKL